MAFRFVTVEPPSVNKVEKYDQPKLDNCSTEQRRAEPI